MTKKIHISKAALSLGFKGIGILMGSTPFFSSKDLVWKNMARFNNVYLRLGSMHLLMSYCGCAGTLMADTGIVKILVWLLGGYSNMS